MVEATPDSHVEHGADFYDRQEVRNPAEREASMFHALPGLVQHALENAPLLAGRLSGIEADSVCSRRVLAGLPILRRDELAALQRQSPPFGGLAATPTSRLARILMTSGSTFQPEGARPDYWRFARALYAAGLRSGELVHNAYPCQLDPIGMMVESGARALGCPIVPAGGASAELQARALADLGSAAFAGPPDVLRSVLTAARRLDLPLSRLVKALVGDATAARNGGSPAVEAPGIDVFGLYALPEVGLIAYETEARDGLIVDESLIVEIVRPGTGQPVPDGEIGEIVVTVFNPDYPLIRFATGDLSAILPGISACGRTNVRLLRPVGRVAHCDDEDESVAALAAWHRAAGGGDGGVAGDPLQAP